MENKRTSKERDRPTFYPSQEQREPGITKVKVENTITDIETRVNIGQEPKQFQLNTPNNSNPYDAIRQRAWANRW
jgi:hypothetical protein